MANITITELNIRYTWFESIFKIQELFKSYIFFSSAVLLHSFYLLYSSSESLLCFMNIQVIMKIS